MITTEELKKEYGVEMAVVVLVCRVYFETATVQELQTFIDSNDINWKTVGLICRNHSIRPVAYKILLAVTLPAEVAAAFKEESFAVISKNWQQALEAERLITLLKEQGVQAVPYKGTAFSKQFYGDLVSRESSDIDLVICPADLDKVISVMKKEGYLPEADIVYQYLGNRYFNYYKDYVFNKFKNQQREFHIEFHWGVAEEFFGLDPRVNDLLFQTGGELPMVKTEVISLDRSAHYVAVLIHHSMKDVFRSLKTIVDISRITHNKQYQPDWGLINQAIVSLQLTKVFALGNYLTTSVLGISLSNEYAPEIPSKQMNHFLHQLLSENIFNSHAFLTVEFFKNRLLLCDSFSHKIRFLALIAKYRFIPTIADFRIIRLPKKLFFLYCIFKPFRSLLRPFSVLDEKRRLLPKE